MKYRPFVVSSNYVQGRRFGFAAYRARCHVAAKVLELFPNLPQQSLF